jgi:YVTN family beta-propeller protein
MQSSITSKLNAHRGRTASCLALLLCLSAPGLFCSHAVAQSSELDHAADPQWVTATLPNGRRITPVGDWIPTAPFPFSLAIRPDGRQLTVPSLGFPFSLNIIDGLQSPNRKVTQLPPGFHNVPDVETYTGVAYSPDGKLLYIASGESGAVDILATDTWKKAGRIELNGVLGARTYKESFAAALVLSANGRELYVIDEANWRVVVINTETKTRIASLPTGVNPIALCFSPDGKRLYIANSGLFEYKTVPGADKDDHLNTGLHFPPFGYPSNEARNGTVAEGRTIPGLGDENDPRGSSLWTYDVSDLKNARHIASLRLGTPILPGKNHVVGGAAPSAVAAGEKAVYVALAHEDAVAVVSADGCTLKSEIPLSPFSGPEFQDHEGHPLRGVMPSGLALASNRLYVTEQGIDALGVIDVSSNRVVGHLSVGWSPSAVLVSPDGNTLYVANSKGKSTGPNGGSKFDPSLHGAYIGDLELGSISAIPVSLAAHAEEQTAAVVRDNRAGLAQSNPLPPIRHVFLIIRENRTFDDIFGDLPGADGDPSLARFGMHGQVKDNPAMSDLKVTPNARAIAARFSTSDNYYTDSDVSADGHRWAIGVAPTPWMAIAWPSTYGRRRRSNPFSETPGGRAMSGAADAPMPEDEPEFGTLWEHAANHGLRLLNYGETLEVEGMEEMLGSEPEGQRLLMNSPIPEPIFAITDRTFPTANLGIPDIFRAKEFIKDFSAHLKAGNVPALTAIRLGNDHTTAPRPEDGYPLRESYVADNDLALGQIIDYLSHSPIWKDSAVFVTEDDPQSGVDHVDAHRSVLLVMSPYVRSGYLSHRHTSMGSIQKTIYELLGLGSLNLEDGLASDLSDMFTTEPDTTPFQAVPSDLRVFDPTQARYAKPKTAKAKAALTDVDDPMKIRMDFMKQNASGSAVGQPPATTAPSHNP